MRSLKVGFLKQLFPSAAAVVAFFGLVGIASPAKADVTLCPNLAGAGGINESVSNVSGPLDGTCGSNIKAVAACARPETKANGPAVSFPRGISA